MSNRRKRLWLGGLVFGLLILGGLFVFQPWSRGPLRYDNFERIQKGMTKAKVLELLGCAPGDYSTGPVHLKLRFADGSVHYIRASFDVFEYEQDETAQVPALTPARTSLWFGDRGMLLVVFDSESGFVVAKQCRSGRRLPPDWWLAIERRLGLDD
jgi:hypothetical protein